MLRINQNNGSKEVEKNSHREVRGKALEILRPDACWWLFHTEGRGGQPSSHSTQLTQRRLSGVTFLVEATRAAIRRYELNNGQPKPFIWTKPAYRILESGRSILLNEFQTQGTRLERCRRCDRVEITPPRPRSEHAPPRWLSERLPFARFVLIV